MNCGMRMLNADSEMKLQLHNEWIRNEMTIHDGSSSLVLTIPIARRVVEDESPTLTLLSSTPYTKFTGGLKTMTYSRI
jgi:hypothetical protein